MLSIFLEEFLGLFEHIHFFFKNRGKCCPFFRRKFWDSSTTLTCSSKTGGNAAHFSGGILGTLRTHSFLLQKQGDMLSIFLDEFLGLFEHFHFFLKKGGNAAHFSGGTFLGFSIVVILVSITGQKVACSGHLAMLHGLSFTHCLKNWTKCCPCLLRTISQDKIENRAKCCPFLSDRV